MIRIFIIASFVLFSCMGLFAQKFGFSYGRSGYIGDLSTSSFDYYNKTSRSAYGIFGELPLNEKLNVHFGVDIINISGADSLSTVESVRVRNQNFSNQLYEFDAGLKYAFWQLGKSQFYAKAGVGMAIHNPKSEFLGQTYALSDLHTEGQTLPGYPDQYSSLLFVIPAGVGFEFPLSKEINGFVEGIARWTSYDYLDDVSGFYAPYDDLLANFGILTAEIADRTPNQVSRTETMAVRGNPESNDYYFTINIGLAFKIASPNSSVLCPQFD